MGEAKGGRAEKDTIGEKKMERKTREEKERKRSTKRNLENWKSSCELLAGEKEFITSHRLIF